jgi:hypothetical protein
MSWVELVAFTFFKDQEEHHKTISFEEELISLLKAQGISYDPRYFLG